MTNEGVRSLIVSLFIMFLGWNKILGFLGNSHIFEYVLLLVILLLLLALLWKRVRYFGINIVSFINDICVSIIVYLVLLVVYLLSYGKLVLKGVILTNQGELNILVYSFNWHIILLLFGVFVVQFIVLLVQLPPINDTTK